MTAPQASACRALRQPHVGKTVWERACSHLRIHVVMRLRLGHGHSNREGENGVTREVALGPVAVMTMGLGLVIQPQ